jgi:hypothetical protein
MEADECVEAEADIVGRAAPCMDGAHPAHQFLARRLAQRYEVYG